MAMLEPKYNNKERAFVAFGWIPKATVQAALGGVTLFKATNLKQDTPEQVATRDLYIGYGQAMLTMAVFAICITAPLGAIFINSLGRIWLEKDEDHEEAEKSVLKDPANETVEPIPGEKEMNDDGSRKAEVVPATIEVEEGTAGNKVVP